MRPCPWVGCRFNLYLDAQETGSIKLNFPDLEPGDMTESCALDVADRGGVILDEVAAATNVTRERSRQEEVIALSKIALAMGELPAADVAQTVLRLNFGSLSKRLLQAIEDSPQGLQPRPSRRDIQPEYAPEFSRAERRHNPEAKPMLCEVKDCGKRAMFGGVKCEPHHSKLQEALALREKLLAANRTPRRETPELPSADERPALWVAAAEVPAVESREDRLDLELLPEEPDDVDEDLDREEPDDAPEPGPDPYLEVDPLWRPPEFVPVIVFAPAPAVEPVAAPPVEVSPPPKPEVPMNATKTCSVCAKPLRIDNTSGVHTACKGSKPAAVEAAPPRMLGTASAAPTGLLAQRRALQAQLDALEAETRARIKSLRDEADTLEAELDDEPLPDPSA